MRAILIIARREFLQRVTQKSFWVVLMLGPLFFLLTLIVPMGLAMDKEKAIEVLVTKQEGIPGNLLQNVPGITFLHVLLSPAQAKQLARQEGYDGVLVLSRENNAWHCRFYGEGSAGKKSAVQLENLVNRQISHYMSETSSHSDYPEVTFVASHSADKEMKDTVAFVAGLFAAMLVLVFINQYAYMVLRGIVEEKQNRISELILTSVKPLYFITGKITGIASVAFFQMLVWFALSGSISWTVYHYFKVERFNNAHLAETVRQATDMEQTFEMNSLVNAFSSLQSATLLAGFLVYFVLGYLLYSALFAMFGVAMGNDTDAQQLALPFTIPLAIPVVLMTSLVDQPESGTSTFLSLFPLTSPTAMLIRLPFGVPAAEIAGSLVILLCSFFATAFVAARVYRTGVLMYGKKYSIAELWKWSRQS